MCIEIKLELGGLSENRRRGEKQNDWKEEFHKRRCLMILSVGFSIQMTQHHEPMSALEVSNKRFDETTKDKGNPLSF
jgi:hypothetical protein